MYASIVNFIYNVFLEVIWQLCAIYNILRAYFVKIFPPAPPNRIEPPADTEWFSLCYIASDGTSLVEHYYSTFKDAVDAHAAIPLRNSSVLFLHNYGHSSAEGEQQQLTMVRRGEPVDAPEPPSKSKKTIIYAEYRHPEMDGPIFFTNLSRYSLAGNELFTPEFVLRYLEYNCLGGSYIFDNNYSLTIMDSEMGVYEGAVTL